MTRVLRALVLLPVFIGVIWLLAPIWTLAVVELVLLIAVLEYSEIGSRIGASFSPAVTASAAMVTCAAFVLVPGFFPVVLMLATVGIILVELSHKRQSTLMSVSAATLSLLYLAVPLGVLAALRFQFGPEVLLLLIATVVSSDTLQYYGGRAIGKRPLAPAISPNKTIAGAVFGFVAGITVMGLGGHWWLPEIGLMSRFLLGAGLAGLGIVGDLFESSLKRTAGIKDASSLIPGHGGVLDRVDGFTLSAPVYYTVVLLTI